MIVGGLALAGMGVANAIPANATFDATVFGTITITGSNLNNASAIHFEQDPSDQEWFITNLNPTYTPQGGVEGPNTFLDPDYLHVELPSAGATSGHIAPTLNITAFAPIVDFIGWTDSVGNTYSFDLTGLIRLPTASNAMDLFGTGTFTHTVVAPGSTQLDDADASWRLTAQSISGISASFSWGTPPFSRGVPAPAVLGLLAIGLIGMVGVLRRKV